MIIYLSLLVCVLGALVYGYSSNPKLAELGRSAFWVGLLVFLLRFSDPSFHLMK
jgi:hypothetical protein